ncbi:ABC transporter ATP-binding protein [Anaerotignum propionicum]|uniref:Aliphatic sulfonates import ATP-binding protein SsuB n=1 Tax=Anaerotignum propionicum DSM 1682 TaxID=991789 RepID=A0A0X1U8V0_ANAPI|nr:ABC transporter ATP-binding protein [Anaerotignum propionicum]AMJ41375.1 aliphatic sulfonates import ATP-binding protein SsuB [Anaerotignum propionicum DSM 1682]SHE98126.1 NitT/TauT family transport system ATP-binding protein [[Clostridium] propionicum DSM 1682] [Anaerotignum propionicum DSM 1682]
MLIVKDISQNFGELPVLKNISFQVEDNEIVAVLGPSGCGKSTLLNIIAGLQKPKAGFVAGADHAISFVFQDDRLLPWRTVWQNISLVNDQENKEEIRNLIHDVGLENFEQYKPCQLSGGMKKRCGIARAFYYKSEILLMDEPFQGLDYCLRHEMLNMLLRVWNARKQAVLFITHEIDEAIIVANRILVLSGRPSKLVKQFILPPQGERNAKSNQLNEIRQEIISIIME